MRKKVITTKTLVTIVLLISVGMGAPQTKNLGLKHGDTGIPSIRFMPDGKKFASASFNGTVVMWNAISGERVWYLDLDGKSRTEDRYTISHIIDMDVSSDGDTIAVSNYQSSVIGETAQADDVHRIALIDARSGQVIRTLIGHTFLIGGVAFSSDGESLLSVSGDLTARLWNIKTGQEIRQIKLKAKGGTPAFSPDGKQFVIATAPIWGTPPQPIVGLYDSKTGNLLREFPRQYSQVTGIAFSPDGKYLLIGGFNTPDVTTKLWNLSLPNSQEPETILSTDKNLAGNYTYSPDGKLLAYGEFQSGRPMVSVRELSTNEKIRTYKLEAELESLAFSPDGRQLAIGTKKGQVILESINKN